MTQDDHAYMTTIRVGRAYVRLIDATRSLLEIAATDDERAFLQRILSRYRPLLREMLAAVPNHVGAQILAASEKALGPIHEVGCN